jgi:hypothetical protein
VIVDQLVVERHPPDRHLLARWASIPGMDRPSPAEMRRAAKALGLGALLGTVLLLLSRRRA